MDNLYYKTWNYQINNLFGLSGKYASNQWILQAACIRARSLVRNLESWDKKKTKTDLWVILWTQDMSKRDYEDSEKKSWREIQDPAKIASLKLSFSLFNFLI